MNFIAEISAHSRRSPQRTALVFPQRVRGGKKLELRYESLNFADLDRLSDLCAWRLQARGVEPGSQVLLLVRPQQQFFVLIVALFKLGAVPIFIDPGMGLRNLSSSLAILQPRVLIAEASALLLLRCCFPRLFAAVQLTLTTARRGWGFAEPLAGLGGAENDSDALGSFPPFQAAAETLAAILFTSGGTGSPKGVMYSQQMFAEQAKQLKELFKLGPQDRNLAGFPPFALLTITMGVTSVIAPLNPSRPAQADPRLLLRVIREQAITGVNGSPAIWDKLLTYCRTHKLKLPTQLKAVIMFGAPVAGYLHEGFAELLAADATTYTPYGATECLPVSLLAGSEILRRGLIAQTRAGKGVCIGRPVPGLAWQIISPEGLPCAVGEVGELVVRAPQLTPGYYGNEAASQASRWYETPERWWHRMGDLTYADGEGRLWFCGRRVHRVQCQGLVFDPIPCEGVFNQHPEVRRSALIAVGGGAALVLERWDRRTYLLPQSRARFKAELMQLAREISPANAIEVFFLHGNLPVDTRHNIKIDRLALQRHFGDTHRNLF